MNKLLFKPMARACAWEKLHIMRDLIQFYLQLRGPLTLDEWHCDTLAIKKMLTLVSPVRILAIVSMSVCSTVCSCLVLDHASVLLLRGFLAWGNKFYFHHLVRMSLKVSTFSELNLPLRHFLTGNCSNNTKPFSKQRVTVTSTTQGHFRMTKLCNKQRHILKLFS